MTLNDDAGLYCEFGEALMDLIAERQDSPDRRSRLAKARALIDNRNPRYWEAIDRACLDLIARSKVSHWINRLDFQSGSPSAARKSLRDEDI